MRSVPWIALVLVVAGCGLFRPPAWVRVHPVHDADFIYGVGEAGPTDDGERASAEALARQRALDELAWQVRALAAQALGPASDTAPLPIPALEPGDMDGAEVVEVWFDSFEDTRGDERTWALARIPASAIEAVVKRTGGGASRP